MRTHIDLLSTELIRVGAIQGKMVGAVEENLGAYLTRAYRAFTDPKWPDKVGEDVKNRFVSWVQAEATKDGRNMSEADARGLMEKLLVNGTAAENPIAFLSKSKIGSKDLGILTRRKDVPEPLRALWGEFKDPLVNYANTVGRMANLLENHLFLSTVRKMGLQNGFFSERPKEGMSSLIAAEGSDVMSPLNGLHTTPEIKRAFEEQYAQKTLPDYLKLYMKALGLTKYSKTVLSPVTHVRNFLGNIGFMMANGHFSFEGFKNAIRSMRDDTPVGREYYRELLTQGVAYESVISNEFLD